ncbi:MAG: hypothetical protein KY476_23645 [Planctomycetes bacterium]|nr:hypothetical protein [Planctomycetota bacterium]
MTTAVGNLEMRVERLEEQVRELQCQLKAARPRGDWRDTYGMFADDDDFEEVIRLGREYRERENRRELELE